jgi:hypothetical protein
MQVSADALQRSLMALLYVVLIPGLVLTVLWKAPINVNMLRIAAVTIGSTAAGLAAGWFLLRNQNLSPGIKGAFIIAAAFGNVVLLGIPVSTTLVASWTTRTAVAFEAFAVVPLLFTAGAILVHRLGAQGSGGPPWMGVFKEPVVWAAVAGILLNLLQVKMPGWLGASLNLLSAGLTPVALITVGLALQWHVQWNQIVKFMLPVAAIQLILVPLALWILIHIVGLAGPQTINSLILQAAMPTAILGFVLCERYKLDTGAYSAAFTLTTALAFITVSLWYQALKSGLIG